ncbi:MAG: helix-turn-helix transcriptional regulator [Anaerolineales bacterium]|jgi:DNA-binding CsgD family transcriptional regulator|nr:helix-turn-helix transcriptional regulator [Anaerolineales bacterium]
MSFSPPNWLASLWERLIDRLGLMKLPKRLYRFEDDLAWLLQSMAEFEQRPEEQVAAELLAFAIDYRQNNANKLVDWERLTRREQQVAGLVCLKSSNVEIAERLQISPETVRSHLRSAMRKFKVRSKTDLLLALADWDFSAWEDADLI